MMETFARLFRLPLRFDPGAETYEFSGPGCEMTRDLESYTSSTASGDAYEEETEIPSAIGRFQVIDRIGSGGMGTVYKVRDAADPDLPPVALKKLRRSLVKKRSAIRRFRREFRSVKRINHVNFLRLYEMGTTETGDLFYTMEFIDGDTLRDYLRLGEDLSQEELNSPERWDRIKRAFPQICDAVAEIHTYGIIHRDLKPRNIMVTGDGTVKLMDFGLAQVIEGAGASITQVGKIAGTAQYMAPEQMLGEPTDTRADIYSLGVILYEAVAGKRPFEGSSTIEVISRRVQKGAPPPPSSLNPGCGDALDGLVLKALANFPIYRHSTAYEIKFQFNGIFDPDASNEDSTSLRLKNGILLVPSFVNRTNELEALTQSIGKYPLVRIEGELGIGKTRFIKRWRHIALQQGFDVMIAAHERDRTGKIHGISAIISEIITQAAKHKRKSVRKTLKEIGPVMSALMPELKSVLPKSVKKALKSEVRYVRFQLFNAVLQLWEAFAEEQKFIAVIEDVHKADETTLSMLARLAKNIDPAKIMIIVSFRPEVEKNEEFDRIFSELKKDGLLSDIRLAHFGLAEIEQMVTGMLGTPAVPETFLQGVAQESEGNPLFIEVTVRALVAERAIVQTKSGWELSHNGIGSLSFSTGRGALRPSRIPDAIREAVILRICKLSEDDWQILTIAATIGHQFSFDVLQAALKVPLDELSDRLDGLVRLCFIEEESAQTDLYSFTHDQIRTVVLSEVPRRVQSKFHEAIARAIGKVFRDDLSPYTIELARHWIGAGRPDRAAPYAEEAGDLHRDMFSMDQARFFYGHALAGIKESEELKQARVYYKLGEVNLVTGRHKTASDNFERAVPIFDKLRKASFHAEAMSHLGRALIYLNDYERSLELLEASREIQEQRKETADLAFTLFGIAELKRLQGDLKHSKLLIEEGLAITRFLDDPSISADGLLQAGLLSQLEGRFPAAKKALKESVELAQSMGNRWAAVDAMLELGGLHAAAGAYKQAAEVFSEGRRISQDLEYYYGIIYASLLLADIQCELGDFEQTRSELLFARNMGMEFQVYPAQRCEQLILARIDLYQGNIDQMESSLNSIVQLMDASTAISCRIKYIALAVECTLRRNDLRSAFQEVSKGLLIIREQNMEYQRGIFLRLAGQCLAESNGPEIGREVATSLGGKEGNILENLIELGPVGCFEESVIQLDRINAGPEAAKTRFAWGRFESSAPETESSGKKRLERAKSDFESMGMTWFRDAVETLLQTNQNPDKDQSADDE